MKILLLGKNGMLGSAFMAELSGEKDFETFAFDKETLDITNYPSLEKTFNDISPDIVINCAAYTAVDDCETNKDLAYKINGEVLEKISKFCQKNNSILIHFSTDYVFDGKKSDGYLENDSTLPINAYGESKLFGENNIRENMDRYYIVRTSWLYGPNGKNFVDTIIAIGRDKKTLNVVDDQHGCPTYTHDLCHAVIENFLYPYFDKSLENHEHSLDENDSFKLTNANNKLEFGIYHITNSEDTTWYMFTKKIFEILGERIVINPVTTDAFPRPAKRPNYSILLNTKIPRLRTWIEALTAYIKLKYNK